MLALAELTLLGVQEISPPIYQHEIVLPEKLVELPLGLREDFDVVRDNSRSLGTFEKKTWLDFYAVISKHGICRVVGANTAEIGHCSRPLPPYPSRIEEGWIDIGDVRLLTGSGSSSPLSQSSLVSLRDMYPLPLGYVKFSEWISVSGRVFLRRGLASSLEMLMKDERLRFGPGVAIWDNYSRCRRPKSKSKSKSKSQNRSPAGLLLFLTFGLLIPKTR